MPFSDAPEVIEEPTHSGISMALRVSNGGKNKKVRFTITKEAQERYFGQPLSMITGKIQIGSGEHEGVARILIDDDSKNEFVGIAKETVAFVVGHWVALPNDQRPAASCEVLEFDNDKGIVEIRMPEWTKPNGSGGKLDQIEPRQVKRQPEGTGHYPDKTNQKATRLADYGNVKR